MNTNDPDFQAFMKAFRNQLSVECEKLEPKKVEGPKSMDLVLISLNSNTRQEAIVEKVLKNSVLLTLKGSAPQWYSPHVITDMLGPATAETLKEFGYEVPDKVELKTGAYVVCVDSDDDETEYHMVEVDRVGTKYVWRLVGDHVTCPMDDSVHKSLLAFSDPDEPNEMTAEPGIYYVPVVGTTIEVIPFDGESLFRYINNSRLHVLSAEMAQDIMPIESDTLDINAVAIMPENLESASAG